MGQEKRHEEETEMFSFLHVLIQQFFAEKYVATLDQVICHLSFPIILKFSNNANIGITGFTT